MPIVNVENACASASTALFEAANYLKAGAADIVLAVGAESSPTRIAGARSAFSMLAGTLP
ncbi:beta-ketoacyl synthase N-terminal-like domain-containing protein [Novosphingobium sp.]|uniref:thiolase family protein n=1 Tax=Novosphingobium sp. TaxID=1874826 RepID=UPI00343EB1D2